MLAAAYEKAASKGRLDPPLLLVLDEAANIAPLRDLAQIASTAAHLPKPSTCPGRRHRR